MIDVKFELFDYQRNAVVLLLGIFDYFAYLAPVELIRDRTIDKKYRMINLKIAKLFKH